MARPFMTPEAMLARREMAVRLRRDEELSYREIGRRLRCSHTAARLFVAEPDKPLVWDPRRTQGRKWDAGEAQDRCVERRRRKRLAAGVDAPEDEAPQPITTADLNDCPAPPVWVPDQRDVYGPTPVHWATNANRARVAAYVEADPRRLVTTAALFAHCRLAAEDEDDRAVVRRQLEAVLQLWGYQLGADGGWRHA